MTLAQRFSFQDNGLGKKLARMFFTSLIVSFLSVALSMVHYGLSSLFMIPSAFAVTVLHHTILWRRLVKYKKNTATPLCDTPPCLKHAGNIWTLFIFSLTWLTAGCLSLVLIGFSVWYEYQDRMALTVLDILSGVLAVAEGVLLMTFMALCYRALTREGYAGAICTRAHKNVGEDAESAIFEKD
ncbi:hypothetical protein BDV93DRAFT_606541 [Ceratobasidium sp. AG-I]|nr:hypothetical protein BDV93DRAFT_606541 [Ceratobasidium sp. AG-I]